MFTILIYTFSEYHYRPFSCVTDHNQITGPATSSYYVVSRVGSFNVITTEPRWSGILWPLGSANAVQEESVQHLIWGENGTR